jgi:hypothetical protein
MDRGFKKFEAGKLTSKKNRFSAKLGKNIVENN